MPLEKQEADALRQCFKILAPHEPSERADMAFFIEHFIKEGRWPDFSPDQIARLFYPNEPKREVAFRSQMLTAIESKILTIFGGLSASDLAGWEDCPPVPKDSPLCFWLPEWMQDVKNKRTWSDAELLALLNESYENGVTQESLGKKYGVKHQRISVLLQKAKKIKSGKTNLSPFQIPIAPTKSTKGTRY